MGHGRRCGLFLLRDGAPRHGRIDRKADLSYHVRSHRLTQLFDQHRLEKAYLLHPRGICHIDEQGFPLQTAWHGAFCEIRADNVVPASPNFRMDTRLPFTDGPENGFEVG